MSCTNNKWKLGGVDPFTDVCKMHLAQLSTALTSPITQQTVSFICGSHFQNSWHLAEDERINYDRAIENKILRVSTDWRRSEFLNILYLCSLSFCKRNFPLLTLVLVHSTLWYFLYFVYKSQYIYWRQNTSFSVTNSGYFNLASLNQRYYTNNTHFRNVLNYSHSILASWRKHSS